MLDQNTDRMWYVIGAVLIGAAIILGMNTFMPSAFASVGNNMQTVIKYIDGYGENLLNGYVIYEHNVNITEEYHEDFESITFTSDNAFDGIYLTLADLGLENNKEYVLRYNIQKTDGTFLNVAGHTDAVFDSELLMGPDVYYVDEELMPYPYDMNYIGPDGEYVELMGDEFLEDDFEDHLVEFYFTTDDNFTENLVDAKGVPQTKGRVFIQANRGVEDTPVTVRITNLELVEVLRDDGQGGF